MDEYAPAYNDDEREQVAALVPKAVKTLRPQRCVLTAGCVQYPEVIALVSPSIEASLAAGTLSQEASDALNALRGLAAIRVGLSEMFQLPHVTPSAWVAVDWWPAGARPTSPDSSA